MNRYDAEYRRCDDTGHIQVSEPYWLPEAYDEAITELDLGIISRNIQKSHMTIRLMEKLNWFDLDGLDYGGGYGIFTRTMRDYGYDFVHYDPHCRNLFAKGFDLMTLESLVSPKNLVTAWEVFEHAVDPNQMMDELTRCGNNILFSTELIPGEILTSIDDWSYFAPQIGQHLSFYTLKSLSHLAGKHNLFLYSDGTANHLMSQQPLRRNPFDVFKPGLGKRVVTYAQRFALTPLLSRRTSRLPADYQLALERLKTGKQHD